MRVRCNWCYNCFDEEDIVVNDDKEYCPHCLQPGYLMDLYTYGEYERSNDDVD